MRALFPGRALALFACLWLLLPSVDAATGMASYYGKGFHGKRTASGQRFNQNAMTAAHRTFKFGTRVKVTNLRNGRSVVVKVNDRGPYARGRIIDLSRAAAGKIGMIQSGVAKVRVELLAAASKRRKPAISSKRRAKPPALRYGDGRPNYEAMMRQLYRH